MTQKVIGFSTKDVVFGSIREERFEIVTGLQIISPLEMQIDGKNG